MSKHKNFDVMKFVVDVMKSAHECIKTKEKVTIPEKLISNFVQEVEDAIDSQVKYGLGCPVNVHRPSIRLQTMYAHSGQCVKCDGGIVKMCREMSSMQLNPDACQCLQCGQKYYMVIDDIDEFEKQQWKQKAEKESV